MLTAVDGKHPGWQNALMAMDGKHSGWEEAQVPCMADERRKAK